VKDKNGQALAPRFERQSRGAVGDQSAIKTLASQLIRRPQHPSTAIWPARPNLVLAAAVKRCSIELNCALCRRHMAWFGTARKR